MYSYLRDTTLAFCAAVLSAASVAAQKPRAGLLEEPLPGLDREVARILRQAVARAGYDTASLSADTLCDARALAQSRCALLVIPDGRSLPIDSIPVIRQFLDARGHLRGR